MKVLFVYSYKNPTSFGAAMHNRALSFFEKRGDSVVVSDLYAANFNAVAELWDFKTSGGVNKNYMLEQKRSSEQSDDMSFSEDIKQEISRIREADLIIFEFPLWWSTVPAILKGWFDKVFAMGIAWDGDHRYKTGLLGGKNTAVITGAGDTEQMYSAEGIHRASITQHLYPLLHSTLAHSGMNVHKPYIAYNLTTANTDDTQQILDNLDIYLNNLVNNREFLYKH